MPEDKIIEYLNGLASTSEEKDVEEWISFSNVNAKKFNLLKAQFIASTFEETTKTVQIDKGLSKYKNARHQVSNRRYRRLNTTLKYAAVVALIFGMGYMFTGNFINTTAPTHLSNPAVITLQLENGNNKVMHEDGTTKVLDSQGKLVGTQSGTKLVYNRDLIIDKLVYNTLTVPYGKRFDIVLSDGTQVQLNAGTSIKYPVKFIKGNTREVFLNGEAFFDVANDTEHPFIVRANEINVRVLGTQFNVSSYPEDEFVTTVLLEGSVRINGPSDTHDPESLALTPGHKASWHKIDKNISVEKVDVSLYTSWINGRLIFRHMPFKNIIKKLERQYNVIITNNNKELDNELFTASFDVETIEQVFSSFNKNRRIKYHINDTQITIDP